MSDDKKERVKHPDKLVEAPNKKRIDEALGNRRDNSLDRPMTKFEAPNPWPEPKEEKGKEKRG